MVPRRSAEALERARERCGLTVKQLWLRYFALGGVASPLELEAYLHGALIMTDYQHDVAAHALNERLAELGRAERVS